MASSNSLAVEFFLLAHDPFSDGRMIVDGQILGCGLVGGKIVDLLLDRRLRIENGLVLVGDGPPSGDPIDEFVVEAVRGQSAAHSVRRWVEALEEDLYQLISDRVVSLGILRREQGGGRFRRQQPDRYPAENLLAASRPQQDLQQMVRSPRDLTLRAGMLLALLGALGLDTVVVGDGDQTRAREIIVEIEENLPADLQVVHAAVASIAGAAALRMR